MEDDIDKPSMTDLGEDSSEEIRVEIQESDDYSIFHSSSVRGGVQVQDDFLLEFLVDTFENPSAEIYELEQGHIGEHIRNEGFGNAIVQRKQVGVAMSQKSAFSMAKWVLANLLGEGVSEGDIEELLVQEYEEQLQPGEESE